ncbi:MAG TPA: hypothetical protein VI956_11535 [Nitrospirota bacterium]|nr:hypothetical protein [Nitrospirota bacterium]
MADDIKGNALYTRLLETLNKHISTITAMSILRQTIETEKIDPMRLEKKDLEKIYQSSIFAGVRTFCRPEKLTQAMLDLAKLVE